MSTPPTAQNNTGARRTAEARRQRITAAARTLFAQHGFDGTGMAQIAKESQVLVGQIYRDFAGKEDLIAAIVERDVSELLDDPDLAGAVEVGEAEQLKDWVRRFIGRSLEPDRRRVLSGILSEGTRNPRIAGIISLARSCLRNRIADAALIWIPQPERRPEREALADLILTMAGAIQYRQIFGLGADAAIIAKMITVVELEVDRLGGETRAACSPDSSGGA